MNETDAWVVHTHQVLEALRELLSSLLDAETGERGFLITNDLTYLEPYQAGRAATLRHLDRLGELTRDDAEQQRRIASIRPLVAAKLAQLEGTVALRRSGAAGFETVRAVVLSGEGKRLMDAVRANVADMAAREKVLLDRRTQASVAASRIALVTSLLGMAASLTLLAAAFGVARGRLRERERAATRAHEEKERFRITLASVGDAVVVTDDRGNVTMMNPVAGSLLGWGDDAIGLPLERIFRIANEDTRRTVESPVRKVLREGNVAGLANHTVLIRRDGSETPIDDSAAPIRREDGSIVGVVLVFRDIHERREAEREQQRTAELLKAQDRHKDAFLATLAHELRNPLAPLRNAVTVLQRASSESEQGKRARAVMDHQVTHLARLVDDLLDVSRIAQGKIRLQKEQVDLAAVVRRAVDDHQSVFAKRQVALELRGGGEPLWVDADATRLAQVTGNLLNNAVKFTDAGGLVTVALGSESGRALLQVCDNGEGIDERTLARLFQPFVQADDTLHRTLGGLGLGLALSKSIVEMHGGTVRASSDGQGKGAEFIVTLPLLRNVALTPLPDPKLRPRRRLRVLIIDDNEDSALTLRDLLELEGHAVRVALDGKSGIDEALAFRPDVVLCDVGLPGLDGYEVARRLHAARSTPMLVALTGYVSSEDARQAREAGFHHHLGKPADLEQLMRILSSVPGDEDLAGQDHPSSAGRHVEGDDETLT